MTDASLPAGRFSEGEFRIGRVFSRAWSVFSGNFLTFMVVTGIASLPPLLIPKPVPQNPATVEKRRKANRHPVNFSTTLGVADAASDESWHAQIMDISLGGLCLQIPRRFEPNTLISVFLPDEQTGQKTSRLVRICWIKNMPDKSWLHGCIFVNPLKHQEVDRFLFNDMPTTNMMRRPKNT